MELSHVISEVVLAGVGFYVFFAYLNKLDLVNCLLWEAFILSVAVAALFGAIRYAGVADVIPLHTFFQQLASSAGVIALVVGAFSLVLQKPLPKNAIYATVGLGFAAMLIINVLGKYSAFTFIPQVCIPLMMMIGFWALVKKMYNEGLYILLGTIFGILATFNKHLNLPIDTMDAYHYLLAAALMCYGLAAKRMVK